MEEIYLLQAQHRTGYNITVFIAHYNNTCNFRTANKNTTFAPTYADGNPF